MVAKISPFAISLTLCLILLGSSSSFASVHLDLEPETILITGNSTILSKNATFALGFFSSRVIKYWYLGIWYAWIPIPTYVWVANRQEPVKSINSTKLILNRDGCLEIRDFSNGVTVWKTRNRERAASVSFLDSGNLVLVSDNGNVVWESFNFPTDTWLPGMKMGRNSSLTCWRRWMRDPSPGSYSLRLKQSTFGEFELLYNGAVPYWSTGNWSESDGVFADIPQMYRPYIYNFTFDRPFTKSASFVYTELPNEYGVKPLTRIVVDPNGQIKQYIWSTQDLYWQNFWSQPTLFCNVYGLCGSFGFCIGTTYQPCKCLPGFHPADELEWSQEYFMGGCRRDSENQCDQNDMFEEIGAVSYDGALSVSFPATRSLCEETCLRNCSCISLKHDQLSSTCRNLYGSILNLRNLSLNSTDKTALHIRIPSGKKKNPRTGLLIGSIFAGVAIFGLVIFFLVIPYNRRQGKEDEENAFPVTNLKVFTYKELYKATRGFSETLGHGAFGTVYQGELSDSTLVAVKRLERPGGGEKEFRAEVCTIGNIHHVNLVRLRGFCSENTHRLLVYEYLRNGSLGTFLRKDGQYLSWDARFGVAVGMARGIAYLHEECRDCIIHCDIKPENILLDDQFTAKVSDFGMAKLVGREFSRVIATMRGTRGYVAPEWISGVEITAKADVYSYGMTLLEIIGGRRNVETAPSGIGEAKEGITEQNWFFPPWAARQIIEGNVAAVVDDRLVGAYNTVEAERMALVAVWCIQDDENDRPAMVTVVRMLQGIVAVRVPPPPQMLQAFVSGVSFWGIRAASNQEPSTGGECSDDSNKISAFSSSPGRTQTSRRKKRDLEKDS